MWEIAIVIGLGVPGAGALYAFVRYLHKKAICFTLMQNKINTLSEHDEGSDNLHTKLEGRMDKFEIRQGKNEIYLKLLLDHNKIPYNP